MTDRNLEAAAFRKALGSFATGVTIVTTFWDDEQFGVTANSFNSVSLDPPLVLWSLAKSSASLAAFSSAPGFAVHILASDQRELSNRFAKRGSDKFAGLTIERGHADAPLLTGCAARFDCRTTYQYEGGDHVIFVGEVLEFTHEDKQPLLFHAGRYAMTALEDTADDVQALADGLQADDLTYLLASSYFHLLGPVRRRAAEAGLSLSDHYALSVLVARGDSRIDEINDLIGHLGLRVDPESVRSLAARGLVVIRDAGAPIILLAEAGRRLIIELIATAKAGEADAQVLLGDSEGRLLKSMLRRFVAGLEKRGGGHSVSQHLDLMRAIVRDRQEQIVRAQD